VWGSTTANFLSDRYIAAEKKAKPTKSGKAEHGVPKFHLPLSQVWSLLTVVLINEFLKGTAQTWKSRRQGCST
jgi:hypothetical protein